MTEGESHSIIAMLMNLSKRLGIVETLATSIIEEQREAKVSRRLMHDKQDHMTDKLAEMEIYKKVLDDVAPKVIIHERLRQNIVGAITVIVSLTTIVGVGVGIVIKDLWSWLISHK